MSRVCELTGKAVQTGNNVSHSQRKTRRRFLPNLQAVSLLSETLGQRISLRICTQALRTVDKKGGLDAYLIDTPATRLPEKAQLLKRRIVKAREQK